MKGVQRSLLCCRCLIVRQVIRQMPVELDFAFLLTNCKTSSAVNCSVIDAFLNLVFTSLEMFHSMLASPNPRS